MCGESNLPCYMYSVVLALLSCCADFVVQVVCTLCWKNNSFILLHSCWFCFDLAFIDYLIFPCTFYCVIVPPPFSYFFHQWWAEWFYTNQNPFSPKEYPIFVVVVVVVVCFHILWFLPFLHFIFCFPLHHFTLLYHAYPWNLKEISVIWMTDLSKFVVSI